MRGKPVEATRGLHEQQSADSQPCALAIPSAPFSARRSKRWISCAARPTFNGSQSAQRSYERYLALAQEEARSGNIVGAENYYQHAEHYFRLMSSNREAT
jgi:Domain of unknown function (DUF4167)